MLPQRVFKRSATLWVSTRRRTRICLSRIIASSWFRHLLDYSVIILSFKFCASRLLSFFLSRDHYQGRFLRVGFWVVFSFFAAILPQALPEFSLLQDSWVFIAMWSVSNLKDRGRLLLYIRLVLLEVLFRCLSDTLPISSSLDSVPVLDFDPVLQLSEKDEKITADLFDEDFPSEDDPSAPTALVSVNTNLSIYALPSCTYVVSWMIWIWNSIIYVFM